MSGSPLPPPETLPEEQHYPPRKRKRKPAGPLPPLWSIITTGLIAVAMAGCAIAVFVALGSGSAARGQSNVLLYVTPALPSQTPDLDERFTTPSATMDINNITSPAQSVALLGPTLVPTNTATPTAISIGIGTQVIVIAQGGANIREAPGLDAPSYSQKALFNTIYDVVGGPQRADDLIWWQVRDPRNSQTGWIAESDNEVDLIEVFMS